MTAIAFFLILISVFFHAGWNFLSKSKSPSGAFYFLSSVTSVFLWLPFFYLLDIDFSILPLNFYFLLLGSGLAELLYFFGLFQAYRRSDISLVYPLARALPVLMVAVVTIIFGLGKTPECLSLAGMVVVSGGCLLMPLRKFSDFHWRSYCTSSVFFIILAAGGTCGYTVLDSLATPIFINNSHSATIVVLGGYLAMIEAMISLGLGVYIIFCPQERRELKSLFGKSILPVISGFFASTAYILILIAMKYVTNVSYVQAFRQMSLPLGVLAGIFYLKESHEPVKIIGIVLVIAGLILVALG